MKNIDWEYDTITSETNKELAERLEWMAYNRETYGRFMALIEAARRLTKENRKE